VYFAKNTRHIGKTKLFKLLYYLDFIHYSEVGRSVTGQDYYAWDMGPVPRTLNDEFQNPKPDFDQHFSITSKALRKREGEWIEIKPQVPFDPSYFTRRELRIMKELSKEYRDTLAEDMVQETHLENTPWHQVYEVEGRAYDLIPYDLAIKKAEAEVMRDIIKEHEEMLENYA
jgi:uncharacterized phage-associated protein